MPNLDHEAKQHTQTWLQNRAIRTAIAVAIVALVGCAWLINPSARQTLVAATSRQPEYLTELYFNDHLKLPKTYQAGTTETFNFTIHNQEGHDFTYTYLITINGKRYLQPRQIAVPNGASRTVRKTIAINDTSNRAEVQVSLLGTGQTIHYWTERIR